MLEEFFHGAPTIYDLASFVIIVLLLIVVISMHIRQMAHARAIKELTEAFNHRSEGKQHGKEG